MSIETSLREMIKIQNGILLRLERGEILKVPLIFKPNIDLIVSRAKRPLKGKIKYV